MTKTALSELNTDLSLLVLMWSFTQQQQHPRPGGKGEGHDGFLVAESQAAIKQLRVSVCASHRHS